MTPDDAELLPHMRTKHGNPYMPLATDTGTAFQEARYAHLGVQAENRQREAAEEHRYPQSLVCTHGE